LWLRSSVLSSDGELIEEIDLMLDYDRESDSGRLMPDGSVVVIENGADAWKARLAEQGRSSSPRTSIPSRLSW